MCFKIAQNRPRLIDAGTQINERVLLGVLCLALITYCYMLLEAEPVGFLVVWTVADWWMVGTGVNDAISIAN